MRFGALKKAIPGISSRILTERLRNLESAGVVFRDYRPTIPPEVWYGLTAKGKELGAVLSSLNELAQRWQKEK
ncbi:winged helix-turn-helix transcriptional regulator [Acidithiobacillus sp. YTS05]|nr:winged helix-turn-helix transcriptional regulator [Acidithiobacillus sp. YTS05]